MKLLGFGTDESIKDLKQKAIEMGACALVRIEIGRENPLIIWFELLVGAFVFGFVWRWGKADGYKYPYWSFGVCLGPARVRFTRSYGR